MHSAKIEAYELSFTSISHTNNLKTCFLMPQVYLLELCLHSNLSFDCAPSKLKLIFNLF